MGRCQRLSPADAGGFQQQNHPSRPSLAQRLRRTMAGRGGPWAPPVRGMQSRWRWLQAEMAQAAAALVAIERTIMSATERGVSPRCFMCPMSDRGTTAVG